MMLILGGVVAVVVILLIGKTVCVSIWACLVYVYWCCVDCCNIDVDKLVVA